MNRKELKTVEKMLGYHPNEAMQVLLLEQVKAGKRMEEAIAQYVLPEIAILGDDGKFEYQGQRVTPSEWEQINPLGTYGKIVIIKEG